MAKEPADKKRAFAEGTKRSSYQTRDDIERELRRHGAADYGFVSSGKEALIVFKAKERTIRFRLPYPDRESFRKIKDRWGREQRRTDSGVEAEWEKETRRLWRSLYACIKARLVAIEDGVETFDEAFFAHIVDPLSGVTMYEATRKQIAQRYAGQDVPLLEGPR